MKDIITGRVWKFEDNISTDLMLPGFAKGSLEEMARFCMRSNRPDWAAQVKAGDIIIGGKNYGCGSSRPAARMLIALGIGMVIAESVARLFFRNAINSGLPAMSCPGVQDLFNEGDIAEIGITTGEIRNKTTGKFIRCEGLAESSPPLEILHAGGIMKLLEKEYLQ